MANNVELQYQYFPDPTKGRPVSLGYLFIGEPDTDPETPANQKQVSVKQEDGSIIDVDQPIRTSAGGVPQHNGSPVVIQVSGIYSLKVLNSGMDQVYYLANSAGTTGFNVPISVVDIDELKLLSSASGDVIDTEGYSSSNDGGGHRYLVLTAAEYGLTPDEEAVAFTIANGNIAVAQEPEISLVACNSSGSGLASALDSNFTVTVPITGSFTLTITTADISKILDNVKSINALQPIVIDLPEIDLTRGTIETGASNLQNVTFRGAPVVAQTVTAVTVDSESARDHRVTFTVSDESAFTVGGMAFVKNLVGTNRVEVVEGIWPITAVSAGAVQLKVTADKSTLPAITATAGTISAAKTIFRMNGVNGIDSTTALECGIWQSMALVGDGLGTGDIVGVRVIGGKIGLAMNTGQPFGVYGFKEHGIYGLETSLIQCFDSFASGNGQNGYYMLDGSHIQGTRIISTGNDNPGLIVSNGSSGGTSQANLSGNGQRGIWCSGSHLIANTCVVYENGDSGLRCDNGGFLDVDGSFVAGSVSFGSRAANGAIEGTVDFTGGNGAADVQTENNGRFNDVWKAVLQIGEGSGGTATGLANNLVIDTDSPNGGGITVLTKEIEFGAIYLGNDVNPTECSIRYRGTSNALDFYTQGALKLSINSSDNFVPATDNGQDLGSASLRMRVLYAGTGTINTSDIRKKQQQASISDKERAVALKIKANLKSFRFNDSVDEKGDKARIHFGVMAQEVAEAFKSEGLDANDYAMFCYDEWDDYFEDIPAFIDEEGVVIEEARIEHRIVAGNSYGIRYDELLCFIIAAM